MGVRADPEQLFRVITNLTEQARQAIEASTKTGAITLKAGEADKYSVVDVKYTAPGLPE